MQVKILREAGYEESHLGLALSFYDHKIPLFQCDDGEYFWTLERFERSIQRGKALAFKGGGHNKFLASIFTWIYIQAPRCWWSEYDTYKVATTANSSSTMHTLSKRHVTKNDFEKGVTDVAIQNLNVCIDDFNNPNSDYYKDVSRLKLNLPESYLQERQVAINYMTLQNILKQRESHRLIYWDIFVSEILNQIEHSELIYNGNKFNTRLP